MKRIIIILSAITALSVFAYSYYLKQLDTPLDKEAAELVFSVIPGDNAESIGVKLEAVGLVRSAALFQFYVWQNKQHNKLKAGDYSLNAGMSIKQIADNLASGQANSRERIIKIIEGWTLGDIDKYLSQAGVISAGEFIMLAKEAPAGLSLIDPPPGAGLEGYLFPDTYRIFNDASAADVMMRLLRTFESKLDPAWLAEIDRQGKNVHEVLTLASIIEKEVRTEEDMAIVSGILLKRLKIGMPLEVDSTINYITGKNDPAVKYADLQVESPYNTYRNYGLPPGPISNPGLASIKAAIYPEESDYLFYLNRQDTGESIFSRTYDEHLANKRKYLK